MTTKGRVPSGTPHSVKLPDSERKWPRKFLPESNGKQSFLLIWLKEASVYNILFRQLS